MPNLSVDELKAGLSLKGLFERDGHVLKKVTRGDWKCRCPFHQEKSASCVVHEDKGFFKCFGCGAGGTIFEYWAQTRGLDVKQQFAEVCRQLTELVLGHAVAPASLRKDESAKQEEERPPALSGRDLEKWQEGCAFLALHRAEQKKIADWRGYHIETVKALAEAGKVGLPLYFGKRVPGFAVEIVSDGTVLMADGSDAGLAESHIVEGEPYLAGFHVRLEPKDGERVIWHFVPKGIGSWPFVIGDPRSCRALVILEGQWDAIAFLDALDQGVPPRNRVAIVGVRGAGAWEKVLAWSWPDDAQLWLYSDGDEAGLKWLNEEECFAWHLRRRARALHAHTLEGVKDFNDAHREAVATDRASWTEDLRATMRRQWATGLRSRRYKPKRKLR